MKQSIIDLIKLMITAALMAVILCAIIFILTLTAAPVNEVTTGIIAGSVYGLVFFGLVFVLLVLILLRMEAKK